jgi:hypothetical protein
MEIEQGSLQEKREERKEKKVRARLVSGASAVMISFLSYFFHSSFFSFLS